MYTRFHLETGVHSLDKSSDWHAGFATRMTWTKTQLVRVASESLDLIDQCSELIGLG
jgi:hypothetical protein